MNYPSKVTIEAFVESSKRPAGVSEKSLGRQPRKYNALSLTPLRINESKQTPILCGLKKIVCEQEKKKKGNDDVGWRLRTARCSMLLSIVLLSKVSRNSNIIARTTNSACLYYYLTDKHDAIKQYVAKTGKNSSKKLHNVDSRSKQKFYLSKL